MWSGRLSASASPLDAVADYTLFSGRMAPLVSFGSTVSFLFVSGQSVPQLPYATRLDRFFTLCFLCGDEAAARCTRARPPPQEPPLRSSPRPPQLRVHALHLQRPHVAALRAPQGRRSKQRNVAIGGKQAVWFEPSGVDPVAKKVPKTYDDLVKEREGLVLRKPVVEPASASAAEESKHEAVEVRSYDPMAEQLAELKHIAAEQSIVLRDVARFLYPQVRGSAPAKRVCVQLMLYPTRLCSSPSGHPQYHKDFANAKVGALPPCSRDPIQPCAPRHFSPCAGAPPRRRMGHRVGKHVRPAASCGIAHPFPHLLPPHRRCPRRDDLTVGAERIDLFAVPVFLLIFTIATAVILRGPIQVRPGSSCFSCAASQTEAPPIRSPPFRSTSERSCSIEVP